MSDLEGELDSFLNSGEKRPQAVPSQEQAPSHAPDVAEFQLS